MYRISFIIIILLLFQNTVSAGDETALQNSKIYSNQDLERYKRPSDPGYTQHEIRTPEKDQYTSSAKKTKSDEEYLKKYWCEKGSLYRKKVEKTKDMYAEAKKDSSDKETMYRYGKISYCKYNSARTKLERTGKALKEAEKDLNDIENEAHRDWIPMGWLRCQF